MERKAQPLVGLIILIIIFSHTPVQANSSSNTQYVLEVGEHLSYKIKYSFLTIGTLDFWVLGVDTIDGRSAYQCRMKIKSKGALGWKKIDETSDTYIDTENFRSLAYRAMVNKGDHQLYTAYWMDYGKKQLRMHIERYSETDTIVIVDSIAHLPGPILDGLSLFYFLRFQALSGEEQSVPLISADVLKSATLQFSTQAKLFEHKNETIPAVFVNADLAFSGIGGLKDGFCGWISVDNRRIIVDAELKVTLGKVKLKLDNFENMSPEWLSEVSLDEFSIYP